jgi:hypothetical protein
MKQILLILIIAVVSQYTTQAQTVVKTTESGDYINIKPELSEHDSLTGKVYITTDVAYDVYIGKRGGLYYWRKSKTTGKFYKSYLKLQQTVTGTL